ncbi:imidazole glycerol phosphate synthase subunit HisF [Verrucomicrobiota bacterium]
MLTKRIIPCLDIRDRKVTKGVRFKDNVVLGDPVKMAVRYYEDGCDELVFYDITASAEHRPIDIEMVREVAKAVFIPFAVGGGISTVQDMSRVLLAGAEKISINTFAVENPQLIAEGAREFGSQCIVLGMDPVQTEDRGRFPSGYEITIRGFRERAGLDALEWAKKAEGLGCGEIVVNSVDADGAREGYEICLTRMISENVGIPVVASGGAGKPAHLTEVFVEGRADAAIIAGIIHTGKHSIRELKNEMIAAGIPIRKDWRPNFSNERKLS